VVTGGVHTFLAVVDEGDLVGLDVESGGDGREHGRIGLAQPQL